LNLSSPQSVRSISPPIQERLQVAYGGVDRDGQPFIFRPLEVIEPRPMKWQFDGLEEMQFHRRVRRRED
jgi:hypothetical protein